jgi:hypothetical protein
MTFDVEEVLAKISNGEKAALLSGNYITSIESQNTSSSILTSN